MESIKQTKLKRENVTFLDMEEKERGKFITEIYKSDDIKTPVFIVAEEESEEDILGDVTIEELKDEETGKTYYHVYIAAISYDERLYTSAITTGIREALNKFKADKINVDSIYMVQNTEVCDEDGAITIGLCVEEILIDLKLNDKVKLWIERIDTCECDLAEIEEKMRKFMTPNTNAYVERIKETEKAIKEYREKNSKKSKKKDKKKDKKKKKGKK